MTSAFSARHTAFETKQRASADDTYDQLGANANRYLESYARLSTLQAWSAYLFAGTMPPNVFNFYVEAQNDALISHLLARQGMWRPSLQSLRSCLENILVCHYYLHHPVELALWEMGKHKTGFSELLTYYETHPSFGNLKDKDLTGLPVLKGEYAQLSKAVHGSSASFLMGDHDNMPNVYVANVKSLGQWTTRQKKTIEGLNLFMLTFHRDRLLGTAYPAMRKSLAGLFTAVIADKAKIHYKVILKK